jgi:hypothetical protein
MDPRVIVDAAVDTIAGGIPDDIRADYLACYDGDRFAESMRYVRRYPQELPVLAGLLPQITVPVTIINGRHDRVVPLANTEFLDQRLFRRGRAWAAPAYLLHVAGVRQAPGVRRRYPCGQIGVPGKVAVERLEPLGRLQQQRRSVAAPARGECDVAAQQVRPGAGELIERPRHRGRKQVQGVVEGAGLQMGLRRGQRAVDSARWISGQQRRALQERRRSGQPPRACARPADRSSSAATSSSGPAAAWARCQARRSGAISGSVAAASAPCTAWRSATDAARYDAERSSGCRNRTRVPNSTRPASTAGAAAAAGMPSCPAARPGLRVC